jgi:sulfoxide reductase heme-binding subunit YedZ
MSEAVSQRSRSDYWMRRGRRSLVIAAISAVLMLVVFRLATDKNTWAFRASMATGYASMALMAWALIIGPRRVRRGGAAVTSIDVRRDVGIWSAVLAAAHVLTGLEVHMQGMWRYYFVWRSREGHVLPLRTDGFGIANWTGLAAMALLVVLVAISNDRSLRSLGAARWKRLQRLTYVAATLTALHGFAFQLMDRRSLPFVAVMLAVVLAVLVFQLQGRRLMRAATETRAPPS